MFKTFPDFSPLTPNDRQHYMEYVKKYPPLSDLSFSTLMLWWNFDNSLKVSVLNGNLVIAYHLPDDEQNSGWALVGTHDVESSMQTILEHLAANGQPARLVHVPEFVIKAMQKPDLFHIVEELDYNEYVLSVSALFPLEGANHNIRRKVKKFIKEAGEDQVVVRSLDLRLAESQDLLLDHIRQWWGRGSNNDARGIEKSVLRTSIRRAEELGINNICVFVRGELHGVVLFQVSHDGKYIILNHAKVSHEYPRTFDFLNYVAAKWASDRGIPYINMEMDLGIPGLRIHKTELHPDDFFRKYEIRSLATS